jgi:altronate hydrolase
MTFASILHIGRDDNVAVALADLPVATPLPGGGITRETIAAGHKVATRNIAANASVTKFGQTIGVASAEIAAGCHVHTHNVRFERHDQSSAPGTLLMPPAHRHATFNGYVRPGGAVGTRNFIGILTSVNCSATVARRIADHFTADRLRAWPNVDGVIAFTHTSGCGMAHGGPGIANLRRTIGGYLRHPNFAAVLLVGLGCEVNQIDPLLADQGLVPGERLRLLSIQDAGGTRAAIDAGIAIVEHMLAAANTAVRTRVSAEKLVIGLQCGGSDGYSALAANPALGLASDHVVAAGGAVILSETPEVFGAENLLIARAQSPAVAEALVRKLDWWEAHAKANGADLNNNPSPGNIAGGITTILEKSLGAVAKSGSSPLGAVIDYAAAVPVPGFVFMDSPGYDPCSATGQIASGANIVVFTTGRGSVFGSKPAPTLKLASNSALAVAMADDIDIDCGRLLTGQATLESLGEEIFAAILATASGRRTASEIADVGDSEFVPWVPGATM